MSDFWKEVEPVKPGWKSYKGMCCLSKNVLEDIGTTHIDCFVAGRYVTGAGETEKAAIDDWLHDANEELEYLRDSLEALQHAIDAVCRRRREC